MKIPPLLLSCLCFAALVGTGIAQNNTMSGAGKMGGAKMGSKMPASAADRTFLVAVSRGNRAEVQEAKLVLARSQNAAVKKAAQMMVTDHGKAEMQVNSLAKTLGVTLPMDLNLKQKSSYQSLSKLSGPALDKAYISAQVKEHAETIALFRKQVATTRQPALKAFATKTLPTLEHHAEMFQSL